MFITDVDYDEVKREASRLLHSLEIKHRLKKIELKPRDKREGEGVFKIRLEKLRQKKVKLLQYNNLVSIPAFVADSCEYLRDIIDTDGLFRKSGVKIRQQELKKMLVRGGRLTAANDHNPADVADLLKLFFRELPEPCIPYYFHDILQRCLEAKENQTEAIFATLLLMPTDYLYTLAYLMQIKWSVPFKKCYSNCPKVYKRGAKYGQLNKTKKFLHEVAAHQMNNRMDISNLAIVWTPNLMPFKTGISSDKQMLDKRLTIIQVLIENSRLIGLVPDCMIEHLSLHASISTSSNNELDLSRQREKKKRRSGSLTRMLSGIRKMVHKSGSEEHQSGQLTPELASAVPHTPRIMSTGKKRKASESNIMSFSAKKRKDLLELLPNGHILPDACDTSQLTPCALVKQLISRDCNEDGIQTKCRSRFYTCSKTPEWNDKRKTGRSMSTSKLRLSHFGIGRKVKKKNQMTEQSGQEHIATPDTLDLISSNEDYVRIPRTEYEEIKNRMSMIESRISSEFDNIVGVSMSDLEITPDSSFRGSLHTVQSAYQKTLESAEKLNSPTTDELARRFSRELKIRGSSGKKVIRSPSARKIGSLRRRSKENIPQVKRNLSLNIPDRWNRQHQSYTTNSLRRGKPNTVINGLPEPLVKPLDTIESTRSYLKTVTNHLKSETYESPSVGATTILQPTEFDFTNFGVLTRSQARRASSFHGYDLSKVSTSPSVRKPLEPLTTDEDVSQWTNAEEFLKNEKNEEKVVTGRPSLVILRSQNAGMVMAKAKLFSTLVEPDIPSNKANETKSREIKKRNSSKSSKERKIQRKDSRNNRKSKRDNVKLTEQSDRFSNAEQTSSHREYPQPIGRKNVLTQGSLNTTSVDERKSNRIKENNALGKHHNREVTTFKTRNACNSPGLESPITVSNKVSGKSPKIVSRNVKLTPKTLNSTPRKSPRQILLKSRHLSKPCN